MFNYQLKICLVIDCLCTLHCVLGIGDEQPVMVELMAYLWKKSRCPLKLKPKTSSQYDRTNEDH